VVDVVSAGFPCQEFSLANYSHAGKGTAGTGDKNQWPATIDVIRLAEPKYVLLENVVGLLGGHGYFGQVLRDLAEAGYDARWDCLSGYDVGASHVRRRIFIVGRQQWRPVHDVGDMLECECCAEPWCPECDCHFHECDCIGSGQDDLYEYREVSGVLQARPKDLAHANGQRLKKHGGPGAIQSELASAECSRLRGRWWKDHPAKLGQTDESQFLRVADGVARGLDRIGALGDGQIPAVVRAAWQSMTLQNRD
jgi:DNA (cytosine-5)-methyltransferase 1